MISPTNGQTEDPVGHALASELSSIKIPPRPTVLLAIQREMGKDVPDLNELEQILALDVAISASLVKVANSPVFGAQRHIRSIREALQLLGLSSMANAVAAFSLRQSFSKVPNLERFWDSSARIAQLSGWLASRDELAACGIRPEEAYTFGLFRDCGIPVLMAMYSDYIEILKLANEATEASFTDIESSHIGVSHAQIGAMLVKDWELPHEFVAGIETHHDESMLWGREGSHLLHPSRRFVSLAFLSEHIFQELTGLNRSCEWQKLGGACLCVLSLDQSQVPDLIRQARDEGVHTYPAI